MKLLGSQSHCLVSLLRTAREYYHVAPQRGRELNSQVSETSDTPDRNSIARLEVVGRQSTPDRGSAAHQRRRVLGLQCFGELDQHALIEDSMGRERADFIIRRPILLALVAVLVLVCASISLSQDCYTIRSIQPDHPLRFRQQPTYRLYKNHKSHKLSAPIRIQLYHQA